MTPGPGAAVQAVCIRWFCVCQWYHVRWRACVRLRTMYRALRDVHVDIWVNGARTYRDIACPLAHAACWSLAVSASLLECKRTRRAPQTEAPGATGRPREHALEITHPTKRPNAACRGHECVYVAHGESLLWHVDTCLHAAALRMHARAGSWAMCSCMGMWSRTSCMLTWRAVGNFCH